MGEAILISGRVFESFIRRGLLESEGEMILQEAEFGIGDISEKKIIQSVIRTLLECFDLLFRVPKHLHGNIVNLFEGYKAPRVSEIT